MRVVGLTGGIGSGKSTVAGLFRELGADVVDADALARAVVEPGTPAFAAIVERFGRGVLDAEGSLDRRKLGALVFSDVEARRALNALVHPAVAARALEAFERLRASGARLVVYDVPLLFENGLEKAFPDVIVVWTRPETQRARALARDGLTPAELEARLASQMPLEEKVQRATWVIDNDGPLDETKRAVERLFRELVQEQGER